MIYKCICCFRFTNIPVSIFLGGMLMVVDMTKRSPDGQSPCNIPLMIIIPSDIISVSPDDICKFVVRFSMPFLKIINTSSKPCISNDFINQS